jgi:hypothetical protein
MSMVQCIIINSHRRSGVGVSGLLSPPSTDEPVRRHTRSVSLISPTLFSQTQCASYTDSISTKRSPFNEESPSNNSCKECLYTGVATCSGLSLYFMKLASEIPSAGTKEVLKQASKQKQFLFGGSAVWAACGLYRIYLG